MKMMNKNRQKTTVRINKRLITAARHQALAEGQSLCRLMESALVGYLGNKKTLRSRPTNEIIVAALSQYLKENRKGGQL
jgi:hypothetical protein